MYQFIHKKDFFSGVPVEAGDFSLIKLKELKSRKINMDSGYMNYNDMYNDELMSETVDGYLQTLGEKGV